jgi:uncharacterized membrane protein YeiH
MKVGEFILKLFSADGEVSSKRFFGGLLILSFIAGATVGVVNDTMSEVIESILKTELYTGAALLGANVAENIVAVVKRPVKKDDE